MIQDRLWPTLVLALTGRTELAWNEQIHYYPPTYECPEEGSYDIERTRAMFIQEQAEGSPEDFQDWALYEVYGECFEEVYEDEHGPTGTSWI